MQIDHDRVCEAAQRLADFTRVQEKPSLAPLFEGYGIDSDVLDHLVQHASELAPWLDQASFVIGVLLTLIASDYCPEAVSITDSDLEELLKPR